jgi:uncharacterized protein YjbJ (UPF0337 family)
MDNDRIAGEWKQVSGKVKEKWGKLTDNDLTVANGRVESLVGRIQERYGIEKAAAQKEYDGWSKAEALRAKAAKV